ncbi:MAG: restriction endonuclease subunit S [Micromonosporaceae bacterium]
MSSLIGPAPEDWQEMPLADVCEVVAGPSNSMIRRVDVGGVPIDVVAPKHLQHGQVQGSDTIRVTTDASARLDRYRLVSGDLICVRTGDLAKHALAGPEHDGWVAGTACFRVRPGPAVDPRYLLHYLGHPAVRDWITRHASAATVPSLTLSMLRTLPVLIPPRTQQVAIGAIMGALDDKMALHREIVAVTEQLRDSLMPLLLARR